MRRLSSTALAIASSSVRRVRSRSGSLRSWCRRLPSSWLVVVSPPVMRFRVSAELPRGETIAVHLELDEPGEDVVGRFLAPLDETDPVVDLVVDVTGELGERSREALAPVGPVRARELAHHQCPGPRRDLVGVLGREAEEVDGHAVGERDGERGDEIGPARHRHAVEQSLGRTPDERLRRVHDLGRERRDHHPADDACAAADPARRGSGPRTARRRLAPSSPTRSRTPPCRAALPGTRRAG